jgi:hypothetical protein
MEAMFSVPRISVNAVQVTHWADSTATAAGPLAYRRFSIRDPAAETLEISGGNFRTVKAKQR